MYIKTCILMMPLNLAKITGTKTEGKICSVLCYKNLNFLPQFYKKLNIKTCENFKKFHENK